jgi:adenylyl-sulfate kinase
VIDAGSTVGSLASAQVCDGFVLWLTGLSGAGKTTIATSLAARLNGPVELLDGDELRGYFSRNLGFSREDRDTHVRQVGYLAERLALHGVGVIVALIAPYRDARDEVRHHCAAAGVVFLEVLVRAELSELMSSDPKGIYRRAIARELSHVSGMNSPYEEPVAPDLIVEPRRGLGPAADRLLALLADRAVVAGVRPGGAVSAVQGSGQPM